ncbi:MAG TPA: type II secretion system protein GspG [Oligoflexus sp.]|uniref:type II secretion system protein GspG n=1 Tax=Oligoflexus sp. TaxID=1971216 RepID=UPI002D2D8276|nr:type II secretion system protein GspG [Oligoflexus sp.]HYX37140.1 type II secretion system protein GspG [Oligoflexus sp.]
MRTRLVVILGLLGIVAAALFGKFYMNSSAQKQVEGTRKILEQLAEGIQQYKLHNYNYPTAEVGLDALFHAPEGVRMWRGPYTDEKFLKDSWGQDIKYKTTDSYGFQLQSQGPDGKFDTEDDVILSNIPS